VIGESSFFTVADAYVDVLARHFGLDRGWNRRGVSGATLPVAAERLRKRADLRWLHALPVGFGMAVSALAVTAACGANRF